MGDDDTTTIRVKPETWKRLNDLKEPGDSFDEVVTRVLDETEETDEGNLRTPIATAD